MGNISNELDYNHLLSDITVDSTNLQENDDDNIINDSNDDQNFDPTLNQEIEQNDPIEKQPEKYLPSDDEESEHGETDVKDSGYNFPTVEDSSSTPKDLKPKSNVGRGRFSKPPVDDNNQPLPPGRTYRVEPDPKLYGQPPRKATLPISYYRKRGNEEVLKQRLACRPQSPLIDFQASFSHISFIGDQDDTNEKGFEHACRNLKKTESNENLDLSKPNHDIWSFGLYIYPIALPKSISCNLLDLFPEKIDDDENRPYWFTFKRSINFRSPMIREKIINTSDTRVGAFIKCDRSIYADLCYGALTTMNHFHIHKDFIFRKKGRWSIRFHIEYFEIQSIAFKRLNHNSPTILEQVKYKIPLDIVDRVAIFHLRFDGFDLYINMKGNVHKLQREYRIKANDNAFQDPFKRQGLGDKKAMPLFSTIRFRVRVKDEQSISEMLENSKTTTQETSDEKKQEMVETDRKEALKTVQQLFKHFFDFFDNNRIHISFGPVISKKVSLDHIASLYCHTFPTFIQAYSWTMLLSVGYRVQVKLNLAEKFINLLRDYSKPRTEDEDLPQIDDRFYRLCLYLHRRSSEYFFLDLGQEIQIGINEFERKSRIAKQKRIKMVRFDEISSSSAYVPSVVVTPTTVRIRPLKLCKLNRVLREKRFGNVLNFALVELRDEAQRLLFPSQFRALKDQILNYLKDGFLVTPSRIYKYLHHSQSQVKCKQFWFYYHDKENRCLSHEDAYIWMGNFDKERVVAKHAARIALCFTSTDESIRITADTVTYIRDIKDATGAYAFSDGVGTISTKLRDKVKDYLKLSYEFSVLQIRYGGCKGTLSVDPRLDGQKYELKIRDSMNKFTSDHDVLEICKLSAPRALCLNRQDIVLLESRDIPHTTFLRLQNNDHFFLIRSLLTTSTAYELLQEKLLPVFMLRKIARNINIVEEPFFMKLIITCSFNIIREIINRTRIRVSEKKARNMFGIVDEYGVLEYGQVFIQYSAMRDNSLDLPDEAHESRLCKIVEQKVVITKNPCHHPGDLRTFEAVDRPELRHLKDVIVFPQKGPRPHSNEISGSDLDGDEYVVIWHEDLIPQTENEKAYDYDSQGDPPKMNRPITRDDINQVVLEVSEQDCLGTLSNIHLAYADKEGIKSKKCTDLAGAISQEVDAAKTGKHPLSDEQIQELRNGLEDKWPDFMKARGKKEFYPSKRILGKLYRSANRAILGWSRAIRNHGNPRFIDLVSSLTSNTNIKDQESDENASKLKSSMFYEQPLDPLIVHENAGKYLKEIKDLYQTYKEELLEIISLYRFQDEIDLLCRCESMDASAGGSKKGSLEDSAAMELRNLTVRIRQDFFYEFDQRRIRDKCCTIVPKLNNPRRKRIDHCKSCEEEIYAKAACAYIYTYKKCNLLPIKSNRRILSFPWLFGPFLVKLRYQNMTKDYIDRSDTMVGHAFSVYIDNFTPKFKVYVPENYIDFPPVEFYFTPVEEKPTNLLILRRKPAEKSIEVPLLRACFIEILNDWLVKQKIFGNQCIETDPKPLVPESIWHELMVYFLTNEYQSNVRILSAQPNQNGMTERFLRIIKNYRIQWTNTELIQFQKMFFELRSLVVERIQTTKLTVWAYLDEYIILALQCIGIEQRFVDDWICSST